LVIHKKDKFSVLIVDDEEGIRFGLKNLFRKKGFNVFLSSDYNEAIFQARNKRIDTAIIDIRLKGDKNGIMLLKELKRTDPEIIVIIITGYGSIDTAVTSIKEGAEDYILKPIDTKKLLGLVYKNLELKRLKRENLYLKNELLKRHKLKKFITNNPLIKNIFNQADKIKNSPVTILITGESGTGKEVLARYIHFTSIRKHENFVTINCAALSENLLLSELFGHEKGAFTNAIDKKIGKFEIAHNGTLFLDEIGDMSMDIQSKFLRAIEEGSFERVGGTKQINVNVRIIAATNKSLEELINDGKFRDDLYYRINVIKFHLPPLRERREDIPLLIDHFIVKYNKKYKKSVSGFSNDAINTMSSYRWPGNVRELENVVNQTILLNDSGIICTDDLKNSTLFNKINDKDILDFSNMGSLKSTVEDIKASYEKKIISYFLIKNDYNKSKTAKDLDITRKTLLEKINRYGLASTSE